MFDLEKVQTLNELEHLHSIPQQTIRQISASCHVSTTTILRFCVKMGYSFSELKYAVKEELKQTSTFENLYDPTIHVMAFLKKLNQETYYEMLRPAIQMIVQARHIAFTGIGTSGILGSYGSRYFANLNINSYNISDPFKPIPKRGLENTLALILSVSGETSEMIRQMADLKTAGAKVLSITNNQYSTIARLADYNISYYMPEEHSSFADKSVNITTQVPVIALIELLAHQASLFLKEIDKAHS